MNSRKIKLLLTIAIISLSTAACLGSFGDLFAPSETPEATEVIDAPGASGPVPTLVSAGQAPAGLPVVDLISQQDALVSLYEIVSPGVVSIRVLTDLGGGQGSGFVIDREGHIVTNFHVVQGATEIEVAFISGLIVRGEVIGTDDDSDLAIIKVEVPADSLHPVALGDSSIVKVGQIVVAIGNPFGLSSTMTTGIISGLGRVGESMNPAEGGQFFASGDLIQTDAAINPGNSGGPLLNLNGEVIGINRSIRTFNVNADDEPLNSGVGFAVSVNILKRVIPSLILNGFYDYPYLGISSQELNLAVSEELDLGRTTGILIVNLAPDAPAELAGLQLGDVIIAFNDQELRDFGELISYLFTQTAPGDTITVTFIREGEQQQTELVVGARP